MAKPKTAPKTTVEAATLPAVLPPAPSPAPTVDAPINNGHTTIHLEPLTIAQAVDSVMAQFNCTASEALDRLVTHGAITAEQRTGALEELNAHGAPIINQSEESPMTVPPTSYKDSTTPINVVVPRKDAAIQSYKPDTKDVDIAYFDNILRKKSATIRKLIMPEYFKLPEYWVPSVAMKSGESQSEHLIRDWEAWRKKYARDFRAGKVEKLDGVFFCPTKLTPGGLIALCRAGKRSYFLAYSGDSKFAIEESSFIGLIGIAELFPLVRVAQLAALAYHTTKRRKASTADDVASAYDTYRNAFEAACNALRAIDTRPADVAPVQDESTASAVLNAKESEVTTA